MFKWKKWRDKIPASIQVGDKIRYEVCWIDEFKTDLMGEMRPETRQIVLKKDMSDKETVITFIHEAIHCFSAEYDLDITEKQVLKSEKAYYYLLKKGNLFKHD